MEPLAEKVGDRRPFDEEKRAMGKSHESETF